MGLSKIDIANQGLVLVGANTIASFSDNNTESKVANQLYESTLKNLLTKARWRFASKQAQLSKSSTDPLDKWDSAYQIPTDALLIHTVTVADKVIEYDRYNEYLYTDTNTSDTVICHYTYQPHENEFPDNLSMLYQKRAVRQLQQARSSESQTQTTRRLSTSLLIEVRNRGTATGITATVPSS